MLHKLQEPETRTFSAATRRMLNKQAEELEHAKLYAERADNMKRDVRETLADAFGIALVSGGSTTYRINSQPHKDDLLCLNLAVRYTPDMAKLTKILGNRLQFVTVTEPVFDRKKAEAALAAGLIDAAELARCVTPVPRLAAVVRAASDSTAPKGIEPGEARVTPLELVKPLKLAWGKKE